MRHFAIVPVLCTLSASAACLPVTGDRILGSDLAAADVRFSGLPASLQFGYAPAPGAARVFTVQELQRIARANGLSASSLQSICFEIPVRVPTEAEFAESMRRSLPADAAIRIVDMARSGLPAGRVEFPLTGLEPSASGNGGIQLWRGFVQYTDTRRAAVWARVAVTVRWTAVVARKDLSPDVAISPADLRLEARTGPVNHAPSAARLEQVAGRVVRRRVPAGEDIPLSLLDDPPAVRRGDVVRVEVKSGRAVLHFDAVAQTTARPGEMAEFRNPASGKDFRARAEAGSRAVVVIGRDPAL